MGGPEATCSRGVHGGPVDPITAETDLRSSDLHDSHSLDLRTQNESLETNITFSLVRSSTELL